MIKLFWRRLIQFAFRLLYNEFAFSYDAISRLVSLDRWRSWQYSILPRLDTGLPGPVLELAHGTGSLQLDLLAANYCTVALDLSPAMGRIARSKLAKQGLATDFLRGDALALPFKAESFPAIVCAFPTAFITQASTLSEIHRVLHAEGCAIIVLSGFLTGGGWIRPFIKFLYRLTGQTYDANATEFLSNHFAGAGFKATLEALELEDSIVQLLTLKKAIQERVPDRDSYLAMPLRSC